VDLERASETIAATAPRRLRIDELLRELGAVEGAPPAGRAEAITVGELVDKAAHVGFAFLVAVLTLLAIPFVGLSTPFGLAISLVGLQLVADRSRPWLPQRARRRRLPLTMLDRILGMLARRARRLSRLVRPRWERAIVTPLVGLGVLILGIGLALPLPIPGSNLVFLIPLFIYAIGLLERDGVWIAVAHAATLVDLALLVAFGARVVEVLGRVWHWIVCPAAAGAPRQACARSSSAMSFWPLASSSNVSGWAASSGSSSSTSTARRAPMWPDARPGTWSAQSVTPAPATTRLIQARSARRRSSE